MQSPTRRLFIQDGFRIVSVGLALPHIFTRAAHAADLEAGRDPSALHQAGSDPMARRTLIVVQMAGGNDGLNTVVPYADPAYAKLRGGLGLSETERLPLDDRFALHGAMGGMKSIWDAGQLGIVHGVGYPNPNFSHFASMDVWQTGAVESRGGEGVLARLVKNVVDKKGHPFAGFAASPSVPPALSAPDLSVAAVENPATFTIVPDRRYAADQAVREDALIKLHTVPGAGGEFHDAFAMTATAAQQTVARVQYAHSSYQPTVEYPKDGFGVGLRLLAEAVCADLGVRVGYITLGGFDTHAGQKGAQARLLQTLSDGLKAFWSDMHGHGRADDVLVMTWSEFGRRAAENASGGTDHGAAGTQFIIGSGLHGGHWGEPVRLDHLDRGNVRHTTDFRSVYATVMDRWLGVPSETILGARHQPLGFLSGPRTVRARDATD